MPLSTLTTKERQTYSKIPAEADEPILLRYFVLTATDERLRRSVRRDYNRIGVALQLGLLRWLGRQPGLEEFRSRPTTITIFLARQLNIPADMARAYPQDVGTWEDHRRLVREYLGWPSVPGDDWTLSRIV